MSALTVTDIITHLNHLFSVDEITSDLCIIGEVSRVSTASSGHSYFTIKDSDSSLDCALFRGGIGSEHIQQGSEILVFGIVRDKIKQTIAVTLGLRPDQGNIAELFSNTGNNQYDLLGLKVEDIPDEEGVVITKIDPKCNAYEKRIREKDIISEILDFFLLKELSNSILISFIFFLFISLAQPCNTFKSSPSASIFNKSIIKFFLCSK